MSKEKSTPSPKVPSNSGTMNIVTNLPEMGKHSSILPTFQAPPPPPKVTK